jgi:hypothetical protein
MNNSIQFANLVNTFRKSKLFTLLVFVVFFSIVYLFLDDKHFSGVNFIKETIKEEVMKKKIEKKINETPEIQESFYSIVDATTSGNVEVELGKATQKAHKELKEQDLTVENIETTLYQRLFDRIYFSIITSTLLGYGDIYPVTNTGKIIVMMQSLLTVSLIVL